VYREVFGSGGFLTVVEIEIDYLKDRIQPFILKIPIPFSNSFEFA